MLVIGVICCNYVCLFTIQSISKSNSTLRKPILYPTTNWKENYNIMSVLPLQVLFSHLWHNTSSCFDANYLPSCTYLQVNLYPILLLDNQFLLIQIVIMSTWSHHFYYARISCVTIASLWAIWGLAVLLFRRLWQNFVVLMCSLIMIVHFLSFFFGQDASYHHLR